jgi:hypothetical protein
MRAPFLMKGNAGPRFRDDRGRVRFMMTTAGSPDFHSARNGESPPCDALRGAASADVAYGGSGTAGTVGPEPPTALDRVQDPDEPLEYKGGASSDPQAPMSASGTGGRT